MPGVAEMIDAAGIERALVVLAPVSILAGVLTAGLIALTWPWLKSYALARPNARSSHRQPTPQGGGIAVVVATLAVAWGAVALLPAFAADQSGQFLAVTAAAIGLAFVGAIDDLRTLPAALRLVLQCIAVGAVIAMLPSELRILPVLPWWVERACLLLGGVWLVNLVNFMDGIDWMTVAETVPGDRRHRPARPFRRDRTAARRWWRPRCWARSLGFAPFNKPVAKLFLGDVGSLPIGLLLGWLLLQLAANGHLTAALILPLYYLADATITLARRIAKGEPFWQRASHALLSARDRQRLHRSANRRPRLSGQSRAGRARARHRRSRQRHRVAAGAGGERGARGVAARDLCARQTMTGCSFFRPDSGATRWRRRMPSYAASPPKSGTASCSTPKITERSSRAKPCSSATSHPRMASSGGLTGLAATMPSMPIGTVGSSCANRVSCRRSPGRMPVNTMSMSRPGSRPGQPDQPLGKIDDLHRLTHVEDVDGDAGVPGFEGMARRGDDQVAGLADGHEVTHHLGMGHRERPARFDLSLELRNHRAVRSEHVAEAHRDQPHARARRRAGQGRCRAPGNTSPRSAWRRRARRPARSPCRSRSPPWRRRRRRPRRRRR